ncbi:hypothetical protein SDC9_77536 [bioreactor metagenome]|uniref:Uncharacterized protein n=1 Tax=bioreactor metagenome TaxID=1076179 RepID=A0A644YWZ7_9ZZZZ
MGGSDGLADAPEEVDEGHARATDDGGTARDQHADLAPTGQMRIAGVRAVGPDDRADDQRQNTENQAHGHDCADDDAQLLDARQAAGVRVDVDHGSSPFREDGWFCRQVLAAATHTKKRPPPEGRALRSQGGSELLADAEQPVHPGDTGTGEDCAAEGDQHSDAAFGGGGIVAGAR